MPDQPSIVLTPSFNFSSGLGIGAGPVVGSSLYINNGTLKSGIRIQPTASDAHQPMMLFQRSNGTVTGNIDESGNFHTNLAMFISGAFSCTLNADGSVASVSNGGTNLSTMLDIVGDTTFGITCKSSSVPGHIFTGLDQNANFVFNIDPTGNIQLGAGNTIGSVDVNLSRTAASTLAIGNGTAGNATGIVKFKTDVTAPGTVAQLPSSPVEGMRASVTDATAALTAGIGTIVAGSGANHVPVYYDGTNWRIG